ncbi:RagB/SusD family nutrient uptake outer membrane protein [uncultured Bacteroides sp.]|uniref:RagB/SusD family nutrient uptake outer membrane protein n=1 Tax=uncultured Bacteroides sp. TaxID=162156 RepID=UPI002AA7813A|nr:RagB/SusD family nutrient uptake outer membrane protein [uncultured Bacteroides sp.]
MFNSCSLDEVNNSSVTSDDYFTTEKAYEEFAAETYVMMRPLLRNTTSMWYGTDMYECTGEVNDTQKPLNDYTVFDGDECLSWWDDNYNVITKANTCMTRGAKIEDAIKDDIYATRTGELLTLRAYAYFNLVETFGGVPLITSEVTSPTYNFIRSTEEEVYNQIVADLDSAVNLLPEEPAEYGRVGLAMAKHLLGKVLLTRSYKSYAQSTDLAKSITSLKSAMNLCALSNWNVLFGDNYKNDNDEIIFAIRYSTTETLNSGSGNNLYQHFKFRTDLYPGGYRAAPPYWKQDDSYQATSYLFNLYKANDYRASERFLKRHIIASTNAEGANGHITAGDTIIYLPKDSMSDEKIAAYMVSHQPTYYVVNPNQYHKLFDSNTIYPIIWKFYDPTVSVYAADGTDPRGHRDTYVFRRAETMMLLAEAYVKEGEGELATDLINELRKRANLSGDELLSGTATIDDVLDESARELFGESNRWMDLKRSNNLLTRALKYNVYCAHQHTSAISNTYLLRPIPKTEIERCPTLVQNPGYPN